MPYLTVSPEGVVAVAVEFTEEARPPLRRAHDTDTCLCGLTYQLQFALDPNLPSTASLASVASP